MQFFSGGDGQSQRRGGGSLMIKGIEFVFCRAFLYEVVFVSRALCDRS